MEKTINQIIEYINKSDERLIIGISGHGASGKSTFAEKLTSKLNKDVYNLLNTDAYIIPSKYRKDIQAAYPSKGEKHTYKVTACMPAAHELGSLTRDILLLRNGEDLRTIDAHWSPSELLYGSRRVTIIEGMSVAFIDKNLFDLSIYIFTDEQTEFDRRSDRDVNERGRNLQQLKDSHHERRIQYEMFMHPESESFDVVIDNSDDGFKTVKSCFND
ncbi:uridine kinase [Salinicoccus sp. YB14-2]|uniref:uridine kinase family protein n=1 Tax=Salinicoccus sp. YB14-2 TaxID=1572701 RepID=UPI0006897FDF|nr:P-loop NTPase fold protein [Salinicoccus sp. YB14-2]